MNRTWKAFLASIFLGILIGIGIYMLTGNMQATLFLGVGIWGVAYFICVGITSMAASLSKIRSLIEKQCSKYQSCQCKNDAKPD